MLVGADTGGTFTDLVAEDGRVAKVLSTPADPSSAKARSTLPPEPRSMGSTAPTGTVSRRPAGRSEAATQRRLSPSRTNSWADSPVSSRSASSTGRAASTRPSSALTAPAQPSSRNPSR